MANTLIVVDATGTPYQISGSGGGGGGTGDYPDLTNKPQINGITLNGNLTTDQLNIRPRAMMSIDEWNTIVEQGLISNYIGYEIIVSNDPSQNTKYVEVDNIFLNEDAVRIVSVDPGDSVVNEDGTRINTTKRFSNVETGQYSQKVNFLESSRLNFIPRLPDGIEIATDEIDAELDELKQDYIGLITQIGEMSVELDNKADIYTRLAQNISVGNNIQGIHVEPKTPFVYYSDWTYIAANGAQLVRNNNNLAYISSDAIPTEIVIDSQVMIDSFVIPEEFYITQILGNPVNTNLLYRYFNIVDLDQRIGLVSALETEDRSSIVNSINSLYDRVSDLMSSSELPGSPFASYAAFTAAYPTVETGKYAYVSFLSSDTIPPTWNVNVGETWRLDGGLSEFRPTSNITGTTTVNILDGTGTDTLIPPGSRLIADALNVARNNLKYLIDQYTSMTAMINSKQPALTTTGTTNVLVAPAAAGDQPGSKAISDFVQITGNQEITGIKTFDPALGTGTGISTIGITPIRNTATTPGFLLRNSADNVSQLLLETNGATGRGLTWRTSGNNGGAWTTSYLAQSIPNVSDLSYLNLRNNYIPATGTSLTFRYNGNLGNITGGEFLCYCVNVNGTYLQGSATCYATGEVIAFQLTSGAISVNQGSKYFANAKIQSFGTPAAMSAKMLTGETTTGGFWLASATAGLAAGGWTGTISKVSDTAFYYMFFSTDMSAILPPVIGNCATSSTTWVQNNKQNMDYLPPSKSVNITLNTGNGHPYTMASGVLRRSGNVITLQVENLSYNTSWVSTAASDAIFTIPTGYRPISNTMNFLFAKDEATLSNLGIYVSAGGSATWGWGKLPSNNYTGSAASLCIAGTWITGDTYPS